MKKLFISLVIFTAYMSISTGQNRFVYPGPYDDDGLPEYLEEERDNVSEGLLNDITKSLPEQKAVTKHHPHFITKDAETNLSINNKTDLYITFVTEGTDKKNALGYYTYNIDNPPKSKEDIQNLRIIFPNASLNGKGGKLSPGDKVHIGTFEKNTGIGWFIVPDGWKNYQVDINQTIYFSNPSFNPEMNKNLQPHCVLLKDTQRNKLLLGFEDLPRDGGSDNDFNDVIFYITAKDYNSINTEKIANIRKDNDHDHIKTEVKAKTDTESASVEVKQQTEASQTNITVNLNVNQQGSQKADNSIPQEEERKSQEPCGSEGLSSSAMNKIVSSIKSKSFTDAQITVLKQATKNKCLTVSQVIKLINLFTFESDMLDMAKYLYAQTGDKDEYYRVNDSFTYSSSIEELNEFIGQAQE